MDKESPNFRKSERDPQSYSQTLKDIRNMLYAGALGAIVTTISNPLLDRPQSSEAVMFQMGLGFSLGVIVGLPIGRMLRL